MNLGSYDNSWYKPNNKLTILLWYFSNRIFFKTSFLWPNFIKVHILKMFGAKVGKKVTIKNNVNIKYPWFLEIGSFTWIGENVWIDNLAKVTIKDNVCVSQGAMLLCGNHNYKKQSFDLILGEIIVEEGAWIGAKSIVCPGVRIETHAILTVGSIANQNLSQYGIFQGNPAQFVRTRRIEK